MARWYSSFDQGTYAPPHHMYSSGTAWTRVPYGDGSTDYTATDRAQLLTDQAALSAEIYAALDVANRRGDTGLYVARDLIVDGGANLTVANLKQLPNTFGGFGNVNDPVAAVRHRAMNDLLDAQGNSIADAFAWVQADYEAIIARISTYLGRAGFYANLGSVPDRTRMTLGIDADARFFFWDDTPIWLASASAVIQAAGTMDPDEVSCLSQQNNRITYVIENGDNANHEVIVDGVIGETSTIADEVSAVVSVATNQSAATTAGTNVDHAVDYMNGLSNVQHYFRYRVAVRRRSDNQILRYLWTNVINSSSTECL